MGCLCSLYGERKVESHETNQYSVGVCSMRGNRNVMEDSYSLCLSLTNHPFFSLFAIFDGFNGNQASQYLKNNFIHTLNELNSLHDDKLIIDAINQMDKVFLEQKELEQDRIAGSTIIFALIHQIENSSMNTVSNSSNTAAYMMSQTQHPFNASNDDINTPLMMEEKDSRSSGTQRYEVRVYWIGDSECILIKNDNDFETLSIGHHCNVETERKRIMDANGEIINNKIDGICSVSRCFGCYSMKNDAQLTTEKQKMICIAECKQIICESNEKLLLFSDGLIARWNYNTLVEKYLFHYNQQREYSKPIQNALNYTMEECMDQGSRDNMTAICIEFK